MHFEESNTIQRARQGDMLAFARIHDRYYQDIFRFFFYRTQDRETAKARTADLFLCVIEKIGLYKPGNSPLLTWLYTLARELLGEPGPRHEVPPPPDPPSDLRRGDPNHKCITYFSPECLRNILAHLAEDQREVLIAGVIEGRPTQEVAAVLRRSPQAVKSLQRQALAALRQTLQQEECHAS
jgi:RNA polymerase sigma-70 factor (ECF subfamily)